MKKYNKDISSGDSETIKQDAATSTKKTGQGGANASFPQEYEEQLSADIRMKPQPLEAQHKTTAEQFRVGIAADHGGFELKEFLAKMLSEANYEVIDFGNKELNKDDDYPDYVIPLADAIANGSVARGIAVCGSAVGACMLQTKLMV